ncbi:MAG: BamA/TamA family outer membrane protein, partial [Candidatus Kapaibacteriota bacterium]
AFSNDEKELFLLSEDSTIFSLKEYLMKINLNSIQQIRFFSPEKEKTFLEILKYPTINAIKCNCAIPNLERSADTMLNSFIFHYDSPYTRGRMKEILRKNFASLGFSFVKIIIQPEHPSRELNIKIIPNRIGKITVDPKIKTSDFIVRREIAIKEGDHTNAEKLVQSWSNLISSGLFSDVFIDFDLDTANSLCNIFISAQERGTQVVNLLLRVDNERNLHGGTDLVHENLFNTGSKLVITLTASKRDFLAKTNLSQTRIWKTNLSFSLEGFYYYKLIPIYKWTYPTNNRFESTNEKQVVTERYTLNFTFGRQIERLGNVFFAVKLEKQRYFDKGEIIKPPFGTLNNFLVGLIYDSRDKLEFSSSGRLVNLIWEAPLFKTTNNVSYSKATFVHSSNYIIFKDFVLRPKVIFGFADNNLPLPDFYSLGGDGNFVGMNEDELLGRQIFQSSLDLQYRLPFKIYFDTYAIITYNIGSVWKYFDVIRLSELKHGLGITLGLDTPIGPIRLSAGNAFYFVKNPYSTIFGPLQLYFSIGSRLF